MSNKKYETAGELMARLQSDPEWVRQNEEREARRKAIAEQYERATTGVVDDLKRAGFAVESIDELRETGTPYEAAVPIFLKWLPLVTDPRAKDSIVRALSVPWARPAAVFPLIAEFRTAPDYSVPASHKWTVGNALSVIADDSVFADIAELVQDKRHGRAREMLAVALGNMKDPRAIDLLIELLDDDEVVGHALIALGKLRAVKARPHVEPLVGHPKGWVSKQAKKTLAKLDKGKPRRRIRPEQEG
ncbi:MAG: HEAT repeat domain-containing protein [Pirellulales bacterium]